MELDNFKFKFLGVIACIRLGCSAWKLAAVVKLWEHAVNPHLGSTFIFLGPIPAYFPSQCQCFNAFAPECKQTSETGPMIMIRESNWTHFSKVKMVKNVFGAREGKSVLVSFCGTCIKLPIFEKDWDLFRGIFCEFNIQFLSSSLAEDCVHDMVFPPRKKAHSSRGCFRRIDMLFSARRLCKWSEAEHGAVCADKETDSLKTC